MYAAAVITLVVVFTEDLPIRLNLVADRRADGQLGKRISLQSIGNSRQLGRQRLGLGRRQMREHESAPRLDAHGIELILLLVESGAGAQMRRGDQGAIEIVRPL